MGLGKTRLRRILSKETGIPVRDIIDYGRYELLGNEERLTLGAHTIVALDGQVRIIEPEFCGDTVGYKEWVIEEV